MSDPARSPGVLLSVRWGNQDLAHEFLPLGTPRAFTIGSGPGCDFACGGKPFTLLEIDGDGAAVRAPRSARVQLSRRPEAADGGDDRIALEWGDHAQVGIGPLSFEARLLDAPPRVRWAAGADLTTLNVAVLLLAAFGFFAVAAANADAQGEGLADESSGRPARLTHILIQRSSATGSASAAKPQPTREAKVKPAASPNNHARQVPPSRPTARAPERPVVDVGSIFKGVGATQVFNPGGLGNELRVASSGMRTAEAGNGIGVMGTGHGMDGNGLGGMGLQGIGAIGTRAGKTSGYGTGVPLSRLTGPTPTLPDEPTIVGCHQEESGCLDKELVRRVIRQNLPGFRYCYESMLNRFPALEGKVAVRFSIGRTGSVVAAAVSQSSVHNAELEQCVASRTRLLRFPSRKWNGMVVVTYPFIFRQAGGAN